MSEFDDTTGMQNPIFKMMSSTTQQNNQDQIFQKQTGVQGMQQGILNNPNMNQNVNMSTMENNQTNNNNPMNQMNQRNQNPMGQNNEMNYNMKNDTEQNEPNLNQGMNMNMGMGGMNPMMGNPNPMNMNINLGMNPQQMMQQQMMHQQMMQQQMMQGMMGFGMGMGMNPFQIPINQKPDLIKIKENLSQLCGKGMHLLVDIIYNYIKEKIDLLQKLNLLYPVDKIKINFYDTILEIEFYELYKELYISGLIEFIFDKIFGEIHETVILGERKMKTRQQKKLL